MKVLSCLNLLVAVGGKGMELSAQDSMSLAIAGGTSVIENVGRTSIKQELTDSSSLTSTRKTMGVKSVSATPTPALGSQSRESTRAILKKRRVERDVRSMLEVAPNEADDALNPSQARRAIELDGSLSDWNPENSLMFLPRLMVDGFELYGKRTPEAVFLAITSSDTIIGAGTTIWLNTDQQDETGFLVWGSKVGAEYNVNFNAGGVPYLYQGNAAEQFVFGPLEHAYSDDDKTVELEIPTILLGSLSLGIDVALDINDEVFLPTSLEGHYIIPFAHTLSNGGITLDGDVSDWTQKTSLMMFPHQTVENFELYGQGVSDGLLLAIVSTDMVVGQGSTIWLNTDANADTGFLVWGAHVGAEYNVNIAADGLPYLYQGHAVETFVYGPLEHSYDDEHRVLELKIPLSSLGNIGSTVDIALDINDEIFLPTSLQGFYTVHIGTTQLRSSSSLRIGIVHSMSSLGGFYSEKNYAQLFMAAQHQAMMAGIPFDLLYEDDLMDISNIRHYNALIFPNFPRVNRAHHRQIEDALMEAVYVHKVGLIVAGDMMTKDEEGNPLSQHPNQLMNDLLDIDSIGEKRAERRVGFYAHDAAHPMMADYADGEEIMFYEVSDNFYVFDGYSNVPKTLVTMKVDDSEDGGNAGISTGTAYERSGLLKDGLGALLLTNTGGRNVHFASERLFGDSNLLWSAIHHVVFGDEAPPIGIKLTRQSNLFLPRNDMDLAMYSYHDEDVKKPLLQLLRQWKSAYNFVGSYYIDIGNNATAFEHTDWDKNREIYGEYISLGNEIGTHSYTHPHYVTKLSTQELEFEFNQSCQVITAELDLDFCGGAIPGNPETLAVDEVLNSVHLELDAYLPYVSGEYSGKGAGFSGAFGFISPDYKMMYFSPNMLFDFTMIEFRRWDVERSVATWLNQYDDLNRHASQPIIHWPWHDYAVSDPLYDVSMFRRMIEAAQDAGSEFATGQDAHDRIYTLLQSELHYEALPGGTGYVVTALGSGFGRMALRFGGEASIRSVRDWHAYNDEFVFLPRDGGSFEIEVGDEIDRENIRIVHLPMRADLISVEDGDASFRFAFEGEGEVSVFIPDGITIAVSTATGEKSIVFDTGRILKLTFEDVAVHEVVISYEASDVADQFTSRSGGSTMRISGVGKALILIWFAGMVIVGVVAAYVLTAFATCRGRASTGQQRTAPASDHENAEAEHELRKPDATIV